jgi:hypothetical protein
VGQVVPHGPRRDSALVVVALATAISIPLVMPVIIPVAVIFVMPVPIMIAATTVAEIPTESNVAQRRLPAYEAISWMNCDHPLKYITI